MCEWLRMRVTAGGRPWWTVAVLVILTVTGCSSLSKQECLNADWFMIGLEDGSAGRSLETIGAHRKSCAKINVTPDLASYERGHDKGRVSYCTLANGFRLGDGGGQYNGICRGLAEGEFLQAFEAGKFRYEVRTELDELQRHINRITKRIDDLDSDAALHEHRIVSAASTPDSRSSDLATIRELEEERNRLLIDIENARASSTILENELIQLIADQRREGYP